ncbi:hypothetical protein BSP15_134 [Bacillus phage BSP15]|uniref:Uncharacterized protein n=1 Tax=Bacillus phage phiNIT1 TaxID=207656 RepID=S6BV09_9CAUD|nr:hypothetical protein N374_gp198 [Bacillus phage phiNIT1]AYJ74151.1 hypothetical protein BSP15_134 [Bacillus phage BSP15]BAN59635.1 hypothetical protein [Bacillus phage phiNIT1]
MFKERKVKIFDSEIIKESYIITLDQYRINTTGYDYDEDYEVSWDYVGSITGVISEASEDLFTVVYLSPRVHGQTCEYNICIDEVVEGDLLPKDDTISIMYKIVGVTDRIKGVSISQKE